MAPNLLMARHGQTDLNTDERWQARLDLPPKATRAVVERVVRGLQRLRDEHDARSVLLVSHGFVVRCLRFLIDGLLGDAFFEAERIANGSVRMRGLP